MAPKLILFVLAVAVMLATSAVLAQRAGNQTYLPLALDRGPGAGMAPAPAPEEPAATPDATPAPTSTPAATEEPEPAVTSTPVPDATSEPELSPTYEPDRSATPEPTPTEERSNTVKIMDNHSSFVDRHGHLNVVGEVLNDTDETISGVDIYVALYDDEGNEITRTRGHNFGGPATPGERTCFATTFPKPGEWASYQFEELSYVNYHPPEPGRPVPDLTIMFQDEETGSEGELLIEGRARNDTEYPLHRATVTVTYYGDDGKVLDCTLDSVPAHDYGEYNGSLYPGEAGPFTLRLDARLVETLDAYRLRTHASYASSIYDDDSSTPGDGKMVRVLDNITYRYVSDSLYFYGEVVNDTDDTIYYAQLRFDLYDEGGDFFEATYGWSKVGVLPPGERTCFIAVNDDAPARDDWADYEMSDLRWRKSYDDSLDLTILHHSERTYEEDGRLWHTIEGEIRNDDEYRIAEPRVVATYYDDADNVIDCKFRIPAVSNDWIEPGESARFSFSTTQVEALERYRLQTDGFLVNGSSSN